MILAIILVLAAALALTIILSVAVSRSLHFSPKPGLTSQIQPIDIEAFRNLVDPAENAYLRHRLTDSEFRAVRRERLRATAAYVQVAGRNAAVLIRIGQAALAASDTQTAEAARQLVDDALLLRRNAAFALLRIYVALVWPHAGFAGAPVLDGYRHLSSSAMRLGRLQNPSAVVRISA
jgi:hypothetical protein